MTDAVRQDAAALAPEDWRVLLGLSLYRLLIIALLLSLDQSGYAGQLLSDLRPLQFHWTCIAYAVVALLMLVPVLYRTPRMAVQTHLHFAVDVLGIGALMYASGGVPEGLGVLLMLPALGNGFLLSLRMAIVQAAGATLAMFSEEVLRQSGIGFVASEFTQTGLLGLMFFLTSSAGSYMGARMRRSEQFAERVGSEFADLSRLNQRIIETLQTGVVVVDSERRIRSVNAAAVRLAGGRPLAGRYLHREAPELSEALEDWLNGEFSAREALSLAAGPTELLSRFMPMGMGSQFPVLILLEDAAEIRARAQQMKLAALGRLSASIAHEIRNPLAAITHAGQLLAESPALQGENQRLLDMIQRHGARLDKIVRDVLELSRREEAAPEKIRLREWLLRTASLYQEGYAASPRPVSLLDTPADLEVRFDSNHLQQVLFNLWDNSFEHATNPKDATVMVRAQTDGGTGAWLEISDNGPGIPADLRDRIFEPFFTTSARGTGLGLYIARELCEYNHARLLHVTQARGACFRIYFSQEP